MTQLREESTSRCEYAASCASISASYPFNLFSIVYALASTHASVPLPKPEVPKMRLPNDVMLHVLECTFASNSREAREICFVCRAWAALLRPLIFRHLKFTFSVQKDDLNRATCERLRQDTSTAGLVQHLSVLDWHDSGLLPPKFSDIDEWVKTGRPAAASAVAISSTAQVKLLRGLLPVLSLRTFCWQAQPRIPAWLLSALQGTQPGCSLEITLRIGSGVGGQTSIGPLVPAMESVPSLYTLRSMTCLRSLGVALAATEPRLFSELLNVVAGCPRLQELAIYAITETSETRRRSHAIVP